MRKDLQEKVKEMEGRGYIDFSDVLKDWQASLDKIEIDKAYSKLQNTKDIIKAANDRINAIDKKLLEERHISQEDREYLLGVKDTLRTLIYWFDPKDYVDRQRSVESEIEESYKRG